MKKLLFFTMMLLGLGHAELNAQVVGKGTQYVWDEFQAGDSILLANATSISDASLPEIDLDNCFLSCEPSRRANYWNGRYTLGVLYGLSEDNVFILVDAPDQKCYNKDYKSFYLKHAYKQKYVKCYHGFEGDVYNQGTAELTESIDEATSFFFQNAKKANANTPLINNNSVLLIHFENNVSWYFGPFANYSFIYYGSADKDAWNIYKMKWVFPRTTQIVSLTTSKAAGEEMTIHVDDMNDVQVDWGDGEWATYAKGSITGTVKGADIKVKGTVHMTGLDCSGCGLTALNLEDAPNLLTLQCADNALTALNISENLALTELDCSGNKLTEIDTELNEKLVYLDCSNNELTSIPLAKMYQLQYLFCGGNNLTKVSVSRCKDLISLWCQDNQLTSLEVSAGIGLQSVFASRNKLTKVLANGLTELVDFWCDENQLSELSLPDAKPNTLCCYQNNLSKLTIATPSASYKPYLIDQSHNKFQMKDFYASKYISHYFVNPQEVIEFEIEDIPVGQAVDFSQYLKNAANNIADITFYTPSGRELTKGDEGEGDFNVRRADVTFWSPFHSLYFKITSVQYPDLELFSTPFQVGDGSSVGEIYSQQDSMRNDIFNLQGMKMKGEGLKPGLYIVNGKKMVVK